MGAVQRDNKFSSECMINFMRTERNPGGGGEVGGEGSEEIEERGRHTMKRKWAVTT